GARGVHSRPCPWPLVPCPSCLPHPRQRKELLTTQLAPVCRIGIDTSKALVAHEDERAGRPGSLSRATDLVHGPVRPVGGDESHLVEFGHLPFVAHSAYHDADVGGVAQ